jgi:hypothetical protein
MYRFRMRLNTLESKRTVKKHSLRLLDDEEPEKTTNQLQEAQNQMPTWKMLFIQALVSMCQSPNPSLLDTITSC